MCRVHTVDSLSLAGFLEPVLYVVDSGACPVLIDIVFCYIDTRYCSRRALLF